MAIGGTPVGNMVIKVDLDSAGVEKSMTGLQRQLKSSNKAMGAQLSAFSRGEKSAQKYGVLIEGLSNRHRIQARMVEEARKKYQSMSSQYGENSVKAQKASQELNEQIARYQETSRELDNVTAEFKEFQRVQEIQSKGWYKVADGMENYGGKMKAAGRQMTDFGKSYTLRVTTPIVAGGAAMFKAASDYESAFAGVRKTVDMSEQGYAKLSKGIRNMSKELPASASEIASVAEAAGQLGIENDSILSFTRTIIDLGESTNLSLEQASSEFARFANIVGMSQKDFDRLGSSVVALGNTMATTESEIMSMAMRLAAQGKQVGMTEAQIMALSATMSSLGIEAEAGGTAMTTVLKKIDKAVGEGGKSLSGFAKAAGVSSKDFANAWKKDPVKALDMFIKGLNKSSDEGKNLTTILSDLGIKGIRESDTILRMAGASDILSEAVNTSTSAWEENSALTEEAAERYKTTESQLKMLRNRIKDMGITLGNALIPAVLDAIDAAEPFIKKIEEGAQAFSDMDKEQQQTILKMIALVAALGPASIGMGQLSLGIGGVLQAGGKLTKTLGMAGGTGTLGAISGLGKAGVAGLAIAGVGALGVSVYKLIEKSKEAKEVNLDVAQSLSDQAVELKKSADTFDKLSEKAKISNDELAELNDLNIRISKSSNPGEIKELQKQYDELARKSGLSKDELKRLFSANENIIKQSPNVQKSVSDTGNEFVETTEKVHDYIESLLEASRQELKDELDLALEKKQELLMKEKDLKAEIAVLDSKSTELRALDNMSEQERNKYITDRVSLIKDEMLRNKDNKEVMDKLREEEAIYLAMQKEGLSAGLQKIKEQRDALHDKVELNQEELDKVKEIEGQMSSIVLQQAGINETGEQGLATLDKRILKTQEELEKLEQKKQKNGELTAEEQKQYNKLVKKNDKLIEAKSFLADELGIYKDLNSLAELKISKLDKEKQKKIESLAKTADIKVEEGNIIKQLQKRNTEHDKNISKLEKEKEKSGANKEEINEQIKSLENKKAKNSEVIKKVLEELGIWKDLDDKIKDGINSEIKKGKATDNTKEKLKKQGAQIDKNNEKTDKGTKKERERTKEAGKSVDKKVTAKDHGTVAKIDKKAKAPKNKNVNLKAKGAEEVDRRASKPVNKPVTIIGKVKGALSKLKFWAKGTPPSGHPGGQAVIGEEGRELTVLPDGRSFLSPDKATMFNLPKGTHVIPNRKTEKILRSIPHYADGTSGWSSLFSYDIIKSNEFMKLLAINDKSSKTKVELTERSTGTSRSSNKTQEIISLLLEQNKLLSMLLQKDQNLYVDGRQLAYTQEPYITEIQERNKRLTDRFRG